MFGGLGEGLFQRRFKQAEDADVPPSQKTPEQLAAEQLAETLPSYLYMSAGHLACCIAWLIVGKASLWQAALSLPTWLSGTAPMQEICDYASIQEKLGFVAYCVCIEPIYGLIASAPLLERELPAICGLRARPVYASALHVLSRVLLVQGVAPLLGCTTSFLIVVNLWVIGEAFRFGCLMCEGIAKGIELSTDYIKAQREKWQQRFAVAALLAEMWLLHQTAVQVNRQLWVWALLWPLLSPTALPQLLPRAQEVAAQVLRKSR